MLERSRSDDTDPPEGWKEPERWQRQQERIFTQRDLDVAERLVGLESEQSNMKDIFARKDDLANLKSSLIMWFAGTVISGLSLMFAVLRYLTPTGTG